MNFCKRKLTRSLLLMLFLSVTAQGVFGQKPSNTISTDTQRLFQQARECLQTGNRWLQSQQQPDGSWRSEAYTSLEQGLGSTALVLATYSEQPRDDLQERRIQQGLVFLTSHLNQQGILNSPEGDVNYPLYATSLLLKSLAESGDMRGEALSGLISRGLLRYQHVPAQGWPANDPGRGGWGPGIEISETAVRMHPANVSVTLHVVTALKQARKFSPEVLTVVREFLWQCQLQERGHPLAGGFQFAAISDHPFNKAGWQPDRKGELIAIPYFSPTCDGIVLMLMCDLPLDDSRVEKALSVLPELPHARLAELPLNPEAKYTPLDAIFFYEQAAAARVWRELQLRRATDRFLRKRRIQSLKKLVKSQHADGHWSNPLPWMLEDDPVIATVFAMQAIQRWLPDSKQEP